MKQFDASSDKKPFHTSGYAEIANGGSIGSTSSESFGQRLTVDSNRTTVGKYHHSSVARNLKGRALGANNGRYVPPAQRQSLNGGPASPGAPAPAPRQSFTEPKSRGFNPFA